MNFLLRSEIENFRNNFCPSCKKTQIKKLDKNELYAKYSCWNRECETNGVPFVALNDPIANEQHLNPVCDNCGKPLLREFKKESDSQLYLVFKCEGKLCETSMDPLIYNLTAKMWVGVGPKFKIYEENLEKSPTIRNGKKIKRVAQIISESSKHASKSIHVPDNAKNDSSQISNKEGSIYSPLCEIGAMPLLSMNKTDYDKFIMHHENKVIVMVDVPNYIRTLRALYPNNFESVLRKSYELLRRSIENNFGASENYIIRYFSKPDDDLLTSNQILVEFCRKNPANEFFHLLRIEKKGQFSDIDNYLIANSVELLERCSLRGFIIVSSDKDYLPVMRIASFKGVRKYIYGVNASDIYEKYGVNDIQVLGVLNFFKE